MSETNGYVTRDQFLAPDARDYDDVPIDGWGKFRIRSLTEEERSACEAPNVTKDGKLNIEKSRDTRCRYIAAAVVDAAGNPYLSNADVQFIRKKNTRRVSQLYAAIAKHCGLDSETKEATEKNFGETSGDSSLSS